MTTVCFTGKGVVQGMHWTREQWEAFARTVGDDPVDNARQALLLVTSQGAITMRTRKVRDAEARGTRVLDYAAYWRERRQGHPPVSAFPAQAPVSTRVVPRPIAAVPSHVVLDSLSTTVQPPAPASTEWKPFTALRETGDTKKIMAFCMQHSLEPRWRTWTNGTMQFEVSRLRGHPEYGMDGAGPRAFDNMEALMVHYGVRDWWQRQFRSVVEVRGKPMSQRRTKRIIDTDDVL